MIHTQFTAYLDHKPGELARFTHLLTAADINLEGISVAANEEIGMVQVVASNDDSLRAVLTSEDISFTEEQVVVITLANKPGALSAVAQRLADKGVNVSYVYGTSAPTSERGACSLVIGGDDLEAIEALWKV